MAPSAGMDQATYTALVAARAALQKAGVKSDDPACIGINTQLAKFAKFGDKLWLQRLDELALVIRAKVKDAMKVKPPAPKEGETDPLSPEERATPEYTMAKIVYDMQAIIPGLQDMIDKSGYKK